MTLVQNPLQPLNGNSMRQQKYLYFLGFFFMIFWVQAQQFIAYTVKTGDSRWQMAQDFGISLDSLAALNPHLSKNTMELPMGVRLKLPAQSAAANATNTFNQDPVTFGRDALVVTADSLDKAAINLYPAVQLSDQIPFLDSLQLPVSLNFLYALPFRLDKMNFQDSLTGQKTIEARRDMKLSLSFYAGALMAIDSLRKMGIYITPSPVDTQLDGTKFYNNLYTDSIPEPHVVFGPLAAGVQTVLLRYAQQKRIPAVMPVVSSGPFPYKNAFYPVPKEAVLREKLLAYAAKTYAGEKVFVIADQENSGAAAQIKDLFPRAFEVALIDNISVEIDTFATELDSVIPNWVFVESENLKLVTSVSSILNANITDLVKIKMFTTNSNKAFENDVIDNQHLSALQFCFPTFYKKTTDGVFTADFEMRYGVYPDLLAVRGFDLTMDMAIKMAHKSGWQQAQTQLGPVVYTDYKLFYSPLFTAEGGESQGFYNQATFIMQYENMDVTLIE